MIFIIAKIQKKFYCFAKFTPELVAIEKPCPHLMPIGPAERIAFMNRTNVALLCLILAACLLSVGCPVSSGDRLPPVAPVSSENSPEAPPSSPDIAEPNPPAETSAPLPEPSTPLPESSAPTLENAYIASLADKFLSSLPLEGQEDAEKIRLVYCRLIASTAFQDPIGLESWRWRGDPAQLPTYLENRALSPLAFGIGSCEDYAAAMTLLLEHMGFEARYLPGMTVSLKREFVDHAWSMVRLNGNWYHLDPQLERNVMQGGANGYRYFLKSDRDMLADHLWGDAWLRYGLAGREPLTDSQREEIQALYTPPACEESYPQRQPEHLPLDSPPNRGALLEALMQEKAAYEQTHGPLPTLTLDVLPPVFGEQATPASGMRD